MGNEKIPRKPKSNLDDVLPRESWQIDPNKVVKHADLELGEIEGDLTPEEIIRIEDAESSD